MSKETHPNCHCVGLMLDIKDAIEKRIRGNAIGMSEAVKLKLAPDAALLIDQKLDDIYGVPVTDTSRTKF